MLFDVEFRRYAPPDLSPRTSDTIAASGDGGAVFFTAGDMTDVDVTFELWTAEPAAPEQSYERQHNGSFTTDTRRLVLGATTGSPADVVIDLPVPGPFTLRAFRNSEPAPTPEFPDLDHHDEQWLIQAWPAN